MKLIGNMALAATTMNFGERAVYFGKMLLIGMGTIFAALTLLWGALVLFRLGVEAVQKRGNKKPAAGTPAPAVAPAVAPAEPAEDQGAIVAAITAAITAALAEENGGQAPAFRVVSFRKINTAKRGKN